MYRLYISAIALQCIALRSYAHLIQQTWQEIHFSWVPLCAEPLYTSPGGKKQPNPQKQSEQNKDYDFFEHSGIFVPYRPNKRAGKHPMSITGLWVFDPLNRSMLP